MPKPRPTDIAALYARADRQLDPFPKGFDKAKALPLSSTQSLPAGRLLWPSRGR